MRETWFVSDTHFYHANILKFTGLDGQLIRPGFASVEEMNERMVENWNAVVRPEDTIYHLGDVVMGKGVGQPEIGKIMGRLNGSKRLLVGNHDYEYVKALAPYFKKIGLWRIFKEEGFVCTHIPLMPSQFRHAVSHNVHGHIHERLVRTTGETANLAAGADPRYINICVEHTNYKPLHLDEIVAEIKRRKDAMMARPCQACGDPSVGFDVGAEKRVCRGCGEALLVLGEVITWDES